MGPCMFEITIQDRASYIESTLWNSTTPSKRADPKIYANMTDESFFHFWGCQNQQIKETFLSNHQLLDCWLSYMIIANNELNIS